MHFNGRIFLYYNKGEIEKFKSYWGWRVRFFEQSNHIQERWLHLGVLLQGQFWQTL